MCEECRRQERERAESAVRTIVTKPPVVAYEKRAMSGDEYVALTTSPELRMAVKEETSGLPVELLIALAPMLSGVIHAVLNAAFQLDPKEISAAIKRAAPEFAADVAAGLSETELVDRALQRRRKGAA